ncbi:hypothetical protein EDC04DRAFT_2581657, partial [Pisolithus marmoratus]
VQGSVVNQYACTLLKRATHPAIVKEAMLMGYDDGDWDTMIDCMKRAATAYEKHHLVFRNPSSCFGSVSRPFSSFPQNNFTPVGTQPCSGTPMEIGAASSSCPVPAHIKCFGCGGNHFECDCPQSKGKGPVCLNIREVTQEAQVLALHQMSYEEMKAFFYDQQINEMKQQGKEFSQ